MPEGPQAPGWVKPARRTDGGRFAQDCIARPSSLGVKAQREGPVLSSENEAITGYDPTGNVLDLLQIGALLGHRFRGASPSGARHGAKCDLVTFPELCLAKISIDPGGAAGTAVGADRKRNRGPGDKGSIGGRLFPSLLESLQGPFCPGQGFCLQWRTDLESQLQVRGPIRENQGLALNSPVGNTTEELRKHFLGFHGSGVAGHFRHAATLENQSAITFGRILPGHSVDSATHGEFSILERYPRRLGSGSQDLGVSRPRLKCPALRDAEVGRVLSDGCGARAGEEQQKES